MARLFTILLGLWISLASSQALSQSPGPTITQDGLILQSNASATGNGTPINVGGFGIITYQVTALSGAATIVPESSIDGTNYNTLTCYALDGTTSVTSFSGTGTWRCNVTGQNWARARISSCVACTVSVQATKWVSGQVSKAPTHIPVTVPEGGTGDTTLPIGYLKGAGTSPVTSQAVPIPCADGGTGLISGTSGGVLAYTNTCTLASSGALTQNAMVLGGGAGATPTTATSTLTNGQLYIGRTGNPPIAAPITPGSGITISNNDGSITISSSLGSPVSVGQGGTGANLSGSGGSNFFVKQLSSGGPFTSAAMTLADLQQVTRFTTFAVNYDLSTASGTQTISVTGGTPKAVLIFGAVTSGNAAVSIGVDTIGSQNNISYLLTASAFWTPSVSFSIKFDLGSSNIVTGLVTSASNNQFIITWTKSGSPTGTVNVQGLVFF